MPTANIRNWLLLGVLLPWPVAWGVSHVFSPEEPATPQELAMAGLSAGQMRVSDGMVRLPGGGFEMGHPRPGNADAQPVHHVRLDAFWLDVTPVTNQQFEVFVANTSYETTAERRGSSAVFSPAVGAWLDVPGADWRHPEGPMSSIAGREDCPVVQVSWDDAAAYARWADKRLPTEAEYEYAARSGLDGRCYPWGQKHTPQGHHLANHWQGWFPQGDSGADGFVGVSPVRRYPPSRFGLYDIAGNVLCWCNDWYAEDYYAESPVAAPPGPTDGRLRVRRGGSWLSAPNHGDGRVDLRSPAPPNETTNHTGFRCARDAVQH